MTSDQPGSVTRCHFCGREFDVRRFQVRVVGSRGVYDSTDCALLDGVIEAPRIKRVVRAVAELRGPLK
jgi:hypothetical protein